MSCHYPEKLYRHYFKFAFVRNPYDRIVSAWKNKIVQTNYFDLSDAKRQDLHQFEAFLEYEKERREHDMRVNATVVAKQKQLQKFINKNRAGANTASQARSKQKQLDRLQTTDIESDQAVAHIRAPIVKPRQGPAVRCRRRRRSPTVP